jgi:hypothetical protein
MSTAFDSRTPKTTEVAKLLSRVSVMLGENRPEDALDLITSTKTGSPWVSNAVGVCQMRLGNNDQAMEIFRRLALRPGGLILNTDVPAVFLTNFATALLASQNITGCVSALAQLDKNTHPTVKTLHDAIKRWKSGLSWWRRIMYRFGAKSASIQIDFPLGELE